MFPCEKFAKEVLPSLRAEAVRELIKKGIKKSQIAKELGITKSAVTQYEKQVRGKKSNKVIKKYAKAIAENIKNKSKVRALLCKACTELRRNSHGCRKN